MPKPLNPKNVPTGGKQTYAALTRISAKQLGLIAKLKRAAGNPPTWDETCGLILGDDWDGVYETLSQAAGSWLIFNLQRGIAAVREQSEAATV